MLPATALRANVRWLLRRDYPGVLAVERASFAEPWTEDELLKALHTRNTIGMVAEVGGRVVGFLVYELRARHYRVVSLAVSPAFRRCAVGSQLVAVLLARLGNGRRTAVAATVREDNLPAQLFFKSLGFRGRVARGYYPDGGDGIEFRYRAGE